MTSADLECEPLLTNHEVGVARTVGVAVNGFGAQLQQDPQPNPHQEEQQPARQEHPFTTVIGTNNQQQVADSGPSNTPEIICTTPAGCNNCASPWIKVVFSSARGERIFYMNLMLWNIRVPCVERQISMGWFCTEAPAEVVINWSTSETSRWNPRSQSSVTQRTQKLCLQKHHRQVVSVACSTKVWPLCSTPTHIVLHCAGQYSLITCQIPPKVRFRS
jgi:hypothetical protein